MAMYSSYSTAAAVCSCVFPTLAITAVALRLWARFVQKQKIGMDDYFIIIALVRVITSLFVSDSYGKQC